VPQGKPAIDPATGRELVPAGQGVRLGGRSATTTACVGAVPSGGRSASPARAVRGVVRSVTCAPGARPCGLSGDLPGNAATGVNPAGVREECAGRPCASTACLGKSCPGRLSCAIPGACFEMSVARLQDVHRRPPVCLAPAQCIIDPLHELSCVAPRKTCEGGSVRDRTLKRHGRPAVNKRNCRRHGPRARFWGRLCPGGRVLGASGAGPGFLGARGAGRFWGRHGRGGSRVTGAGGFLAVTLAAPPGSSVPARRGSGRPGARGVLSRPSRAAVIVGVRLGRFWPSKRAPPAFGEARDTAGNLCWEHGRGPVGEPTGARWSLGGTWHGPGFRRHPGAAGSGRAPGRSAFSHWPRPAAAPAASTAWLPRSAVVNPTAEMWL